MATIQARSGQRTTAAPSRVPEAIRNALLALCLGFVGMAAAADFISTGGMATPRSLHTATSLLDGRVLVAGGNGGANLAELYDPATGGFATTGSMSAPRSYHTATLLPDGKVLIAGGFGNGTSLAGAELYDPASGSFASTGGMTASRYAHTATKLADGRVLIAGGFSLNGTVAALASAEIYDPATGIFTATGSMASARFWHMATPLPNGKVLVAGGRGTSGGLASAEVYDPDTGAFATTGGMAQARYSATATALANGKVLIAGGSTGTSAIAGAELYDPATGGFSASVGMLEARSDHTATLLPDGQVLVAGGKLNATAYFASAELYDPVANGFTRATGMTAARYSHTATRLATGRVLIAGGPSLATAELYTSAPPPVADAGADQNIYLGQSATLSGADSSDAGGASLTYTWTLEAKPAGSAASLSSTGGVTTSLHADVVGEYLVSLVVDNGADTSAADTVLVNVDRNLPPVAAVTGAPLTGDAPLVVLFDGSGSADNEGGQLSYSWDFGDGTPADTAVNPNHTYSAPGSYTALLTVTDDFGNVDQASVAITVTAPNVPPSVSPTASPASGGAPFAVQFAANARDPEGAVLAYAWDFGDGTPASTLANPSHTYAAPGAYTANVMVTDGVYLVNGAVTVSVGSVLADDVTWAKVKFGKPGKVDDSVDLEARFTYPGTPDGTIKVVFDGVTLLEVPVKSFAREGRGRYEYRGRNVNAKLDLARGTLKVSRHRMLLTGIDNSNGIDLLIAFGGAVGTDHFVMHEHKQHGERSLHYSKKDGKKHGDGRRWWQRWNRK